METEGDADERVSCEWLSADYWGSLEGEQEEETGWAGGWA